MCSFWAGGISSFPFSRAREYRLLRRLLLLSTCYHVTCISRTILRIYVIVMASVEDMEKLNETKLFSFQICIKTVQFVY
jgi:hypothetical protein